MTMKQRSLVSLLLNPDEFREARSKEIAIHDDPLIIEKLIDYIYREDYDDSFEPAIEPQPGTPPAEMASAEPEPAIEPRAEAPLPKLDPATRTDDITKAHINIRIYTVADKYAINQLMILTIHYGVTLIKHLFSDFGCCETVRGNTRCLDYM
ncbi:hypothetical protein BO82DRAFT_396916 [Aspergillus uvarum CBS 121591]|uniref:BTB domain-containing protein n=1 Tax=Aspergillus uvarum CBS 121591 TaxID=1448315 RepID=A0A319BPI3_9EURO|nr:hypothetical protein BO82DRAFT_396916 [Aspergillus uvarum CBS 121591]PYH75326.1 hypothetical protein BO82DRAFT_396916 [Aspergillus uvarum CBS 121591]